MVSLQHLAGAQRLWRRFGRRHQLNELRAEHGRRGDVDERVGGNEMQPRRVHREVDSGLPVGQRFDRVDLTHLRPVQLDLRVEVHHQTSARRQHGYRHAGRCAAIEQDDGAGDNRRDNHKGGQTSQRLNSTATRLINSRSTRVSSVRHRLVPLARQVEVAVGTVDGQRDQQRHRYDHDQRGAYRIAGRDTDTGRSARRKIAVIRMD